MIDLVDEVVSLDLMTDDEYKTLYHGENIDLESIDKEDFNDRLLLMRSIKGDELARNKFILSKMDYVRKVVSYDKEIKSLKSRGLDDDDLFQTGVIGVISCIDKFDFRPEIKVKTYINNCIKYSIKNTYRKYGTISVSREANSIYKICSSKMDLLEDKIDYRKILEISRLNDIPVSRLVNSIMAVKGRNCQYRYDNDGCIDIDIGSREKYSRNLLLKYRQEERRKFDYWMIRESLDTLDEKERFVISEIYLKDKTQKEVAKELACSATSIGNIKKKAIEKIRYMIRDLED
nr:sigma-70 family RNA polymerase sigma factor [uncultured Peptostreptococcus sp.]